MKLWSGVLSPFSAKVRIALAEKNLPFDVLEIPWTRETLWGPKPPEFLAVSPYGKVPVLIDGDVALHDSTVINEYLEDRYPEPALLPAEPAERARCRQLEDDADAAMTDHVTVLIQEVYRKPDESTRDLALIAQATDGLGGYFGTLDKELAGLEYLCGAFSLADASVFMVVMFAASIGAPPAEAHTNLAAWMARMSARPVIAKEAAAMLSASATT